MRLFFFVLLGTLSLSLFSQGAILIEEGSVSSVSSSSKRFYPDAMALRGDHRVGVGLVTSGAYGIAGAQMELNFVESESLVIGYGGLKGVRTFNLSWKKLFPGQWFAPYTKIGLSHWSRIGKSGGTVKLSEARIRPQTFIVPSVGLQYVQLGGAWSGSSLYAELNLLMGTQDFSALANGSVGFLYYF